MHLKRIAVPRSASSTRVARHRPRTPWPYRARRTGRSHATLQRTWRSQIAEPRCVLVYGIAFQEQEYR